MENIDIEKILGVIESPETGNNALNLLQMLDQANTVLGKITSLMDKLEGMGLKPLLVRGAGKQLGIDAETPLRTDDGIVPSTENHKAVFTQLNRMSEKELTELFTDGTNETNDQPATNTD